MPKTTDPSRPLEVQQVPLASLFPDPANARVHDERNLDAIKGSLARFGQQKPIVVDQTGRILAGNGTYQAARALGWTELQVTVTDLAGLEAAAYAIADNRTSDLSEFDEDVLAVLLGELREEDALAGLGFQDSEIDALLAKMEAGEPAGELEDPGPEEPPDHPVSRPGDLWLLGDHRVLCGDSRDHAALNRLLDGRRADLVWTDPPYGVNYAGGTADALRIEGDCPDGLHELLTLALGNAAKCSKPGAVWYVAAPAGPQFVAFAQVLSDLGIWRQTLVWAKDAFVLGHSDFHYRHEALFYGWVPGADHRRPPGRSNDTIWEFERPRRSADHPTSKPVELVGHSLKLSSLRANLVLDPFLGSGSALLACEQHGRHCCGLEVDPRYVDVAVRRWEEATGREAGLADGGTFAEVRAEREAEG